VNRRNRNYKFKQKAVSKRKKNTAGAAELADKIHQRSGTSKLIWEVQYLCSRIKIIFKIP